MGGLKGGGGIKGQWGVDGRFSLWEGLREEEGSMGS